MERLRGVYRYLKRKYDLLSLKKYTTIAGTLVFFLIMSIVPLAFWLTLLIGKLPVDTERILSLPVFESVKNVLESVQEEAKNATAGASLLLLFTTLYSSTTLFYQMRRSGELIYDFHRKKQGLRLRLGALVLLLIVMLSAVLFVLVFALGSFFFSRILSRKLEMAADYLLLAVVSFFLVLLLNMYICPYKAKVRLFLPGTVITVSSWVIAVFGFSLYLRISNMNRLYGALSALIIFLLWLYILMVCFIVGVIFNSERVITARKKEQKKRKGRNIEKKRIRRIKKCRKDILQT